MAGQRKRIFHQTCRGCGAHMVTQPNVGAGQTVVCKCGLTQPGLPSLWWSWDRIDALRARDREHYRRWKEKKLAQVESK